MPRLPRMHTCGAHDLVAFFPEDNRLYLVLDEHHVSSHIALKRKLWSRMRKLKREARYGAWFTLWKLLGQLRSQ